jgi:CHAT domain-containing protein
MELQTLIVERAAPGSAAEAAGLRRGDRLFTFGGKVLSSPAMLQALEENTFGIDRVTLSGERGGQPWEWSLTLGKPGSETRPELPDAVLEEYERGREALLAQGYAEAMRLWGGIAPRIPGKSVRAWLYQKIGEAGRSGLEFRSAQDALMMAHELLREGTDVAAQVWAWQQMSACCRCVSDLDAAHRWLELARQADEAMGWLRWQASDMSVLGIIAQDSGDLGEAKDYLSQARVLCEKFDPGGMGVASNLNNLGNVALLEGDLVTAARHFADSHEIWKRIVPGTDHDALGYNNLGRIASLQGDLSTALDLFNQALRINIQIDPASHETGLYLNNIGCILVIRGDLASAREHFVRALGIWQRREPDPVCIASAHENLGEVAFRQGDLDVATERHLQALRIRETLAALSPNVAGSLMGLGDVSLKRSDPSAAEDCYRRALSIYESIVPDSLETASCLEGMGRVDLARQRPSEAVTCFRRSVEIIERYRAQIIAPETRALLLAQHMHKYAGLVQSHLAIGDVAASFHALESARARSFVELLAARALDTVTDAPTGLLAEQKEVDRLRGQAYDRLSGLTGADSDAEAVEALHRTLRELERRQQEVTAKIRAASPRYASLQYPQPLTLAETQAFLEPGTLLLSYLVDDDQAFLFAVTSAHAEAHTIPVGREGLQAQVRAFRQATDRRRLGHDPAREAAQARALYALLVGPVHALVRRAERLLLCPDGPLHTLPFAALVTNGRGKSKYLGAEKPLGHALSMTTHAQARAARPQHGPSRLPKRPHLLAFGDPLYSTAARQYESTSARDELSLLQTRGLSLAPLPHSRTEVEGLARLYGADASIRLGAEATKAAILQEGGDADLLHLACHAWFDPTQPLSSGLVLSRDETPDGDSGLLQAWEVFQRMRLSADLVVLSACQSGLGQEVRGEGLVGLTRAFQYAGARSLVASLWDVADESTAAFMLAFYASLKSGLGKDDALQQAVLAHQADPRWDSPFHWAAFVLIGDRQ